MAGGWERRGSAALVGLVACVVPGVAVAGSGLVSVSGANLVRDGQPWIPHGFNQIAFVLPPGVPATKPLFRVAADREVRAEANASDHAPAWVRLRDDAASVGRRRALRGSAKAR